MNDNEPTIDQRIKVLEAAAQKARLEAIDVTGKTSTRANSQCSSQYLEGPLIPASRNRTKG